MKKMSKLLLAFLMILSMFGINDVNALDNESLLDKFPNTIEVLKDFFRDSGKYQIFSNDSEDITDAFYNDNINFFVEKDYLSILEDYIERGKMITTLIEEENKTRLMQNVSNKFLVYALLKVNGQVRSEYAFYLRGRASWNDATGKYTSISAPSIEEYSVDPNWSTHNVGFDADYEIVNNGRTARYKNLVLVVVATGTNGGNGAITVNYDPFIPGFIFEMDINKTIIYM